MYKRTWNALLALLLLYTSPLACDHAAAGEGGSEVRATSVSRGYYILEEIFSSRIYVVEAGSDNKQTVILVHGLGDEASETWKDLIPLLAQNFHVIAFDLPGFGRSDVTSALYSPENYARLLTWITQKYGTGEHFVIGHSLGGAISLSYAATQPDRLLGLILVDVAGILHRSVLMNHLLQSAIKNRSPNFPEFLSEAVDNIISELVFSLDRPHLNTNLILNTPLLRKTLLGNNPYKIASLALAETDFSPIVFQTLCPTLIVWGGRDTVSPLRTGYLLNTALINSRLKIIAGAGHSPMKDRPAEFQSMVMDFTKQLDHDADMLPENLSDRHYLGHQERDLTLSGDFRIVEVTNSKNITLRNLRTGSMVLNNTTATLENVTIQGGAKGLSLSESEIIASGITIEAPRALTIIKSRGDFAGADIRSGEEIAPLDQQSSLVFSASRIEVDGHTRYLNGPLDSKVDPKKP